MSYRTTLTLSTRGIIVSALIGVVAGVIASVVERVDAALTGGTATPLGYTNTYTWLLLMALLYGPVGALITTEVQALIGLATGANPLSWLWIGVNGMFAVVAGAAILGVQRVRPNAGWLPKLLAGTAALALLDVPAVYLVIVTVLGLPIFVYYAALPLYLGLQLIPVTGIGYALLRVLLASNVLD